MDPTATVTYTTANVSGTLDPGDVENAYFFEHSADPAGEGWTRGGWLGFVPAGSGAVPVSGEITGLKPGTQYFVRLGALDFTTFEVTSSKPPLLIETKDVAAPAVSISAPTQVDEDGAHFSGEINPGGSESVFEVAWRFQCTPECPGLSGTLAPDGSSHVVEADATGLLPGTEYEVRLVAKNAGDPVSAGPETFATTPLAPRIITLRADPTSDEALLEARIGPGGRSTSYRFEYGTAASYGQSTATQFTAATGAEVKVKANLSDLAPGTTYHYRLVATNSEGSAESTDGTFTTLPAPGGEGCANEALRQQQGAAFLPACRAFEMVSPLDKNGYHANFASGKPLYVTASVSGDRLAYWSMGSFADSSQAVELFLPYLATRGANDWGTQALNKPLPENLPEYTPPKYLNGTNPAILSPELDRIAGSNSTSNMVWRRNISTDELTVLFTSVQEYGSAGEITAATPDLGHLVLSAAQQPWELYTDDGGVVHKRNYAIDPDGVPFSAEFLQAYAPGISPDGERILFVPGGAFNYGLAGWAMGSTSGIYLRDTGGTAPSTIQISKPEPGVPVGGSACPPYPDCQSAVPWRFTQDLSRIFLTSPDPLTADAANVTTGRYSSFGDLYVYDAASGDLRDISIDAGRPEGAEVQGVAGISKDGNVAYFVALGQLGTGEGALGDFNVFRWEDGPGNGSVEYVTSLAPGEYLNSQFDPRVTASRVSPDGDLFAFTSRRALTDFDNEGKPQIYVYEHESGEITCVSCHVLASSTSGSSLEPARSTMSTPREVKQSLIGNRLVLFETADPLVRNDSNGRVDVYQFDLRRRELSLLTTGRSPVDSFFIGASTDGRDVFIATGERLVSRDNDDLVDIYDARANGGLAAQNPPPGSPACDGEGCQPGMPVLPAPASPATSTYAGDGNARGRACKPSRRGQAKKPRAKCKPRSKGKERAAAKRGQAKRGGGK